MNKKFRLIKLLPIIVIILVLSGIGLCLYMVSPTGKSSEAVDFNIEYGTSPRDVIHNLKSSDLIKSEKFTLVYLKLNKISGINAGEFHLNKGMSLKKIFEVLTTTGFVKGESIEMTFLPGHTYMDYVKTISKKLEISESEVLNTIKDKDYINSLIEKYWFLTNDILNTDIYYPLEGYLAGDTYEFKKDVTVKEVIEKLLDQEKNILDKFKTNIDKSNYSIHEIMTLASISEKEGKKLEDRKNIVGVFINRLNNGDKLGSDVTTYYSLGLKLYERDLTYDEIITPNAYNTRSDNLAGKLPVGPICNPSKDAIDSVINYTSNDYYYFVSDKNSKIYFTKTFEEHEAKVNELQENGLWFEYDEE